MELEEIDKKIDELNATRQEFGLTNEQEFALIKLRRLKNGVGN